MSDEADSSRFVNSTAQCREATGRRCADMIFSSFRTAIWFFQHGNRNAFMPVTLCLSVRILLSRMDMEEDFFVHGKGEESRPLG